MGLLPCATPGAAAALTAASGPSRTGPPSHVAVQDGGRAQVQVEQAARSAQCNVHAPPPGQLHSRRRQAGTLLQHVVQAAARAVLCSTWARIRALEQQAVSCVPLSCLLLLLQQRLAAWLHPPVRMHGGSVHRPRKETRWGCRMRHMTPASCTASGRDHSGGSGMAVVALMAASGPLGLELEAGWSWARCDGLARWAWQGERLPHQLSRARPHDVGGPAPPAAAA